MHRCPSIEKDFWRELTDFWVFLLESFWRGCEFSLDHPYSSTCLEKRLRHSCSLFSSSSGRPPPPPPLIPLVLLPGRRTEIQPDSLAGIWAMLLGSCSQIRPVSSSPSSSSQLELPWHIVLRLLPSAYSSLVCQRAVIFSPARVICWPFLVTFFLLSHKNNFPRLVTFFSLFRSPSPTGWVEWCFWQCCSERNTGESTIDPFTRNVFSTLIFRSRSVCPTFELSLGDGPVCFTDPSLGAARCVGGNVIPGGRSHGWEQHSRFPYSASSGSVSAPGHCRTPPA